MKFFLLPLFLTRCSLFALSLVGSLAAETVVVINEFKSDSPGTDAGEFLELFAHDSITGEGVAGFPLDGLVVVFFNGSTASNPAYAVTPVGGSATAAIKLDGRKCNRSGFFVIGSLGVAGSDIELAPGGIGWFQNGADAVGLYRHPTIEFTAATGATSADLIDAIVYGTDDPEDGDLLETLTPGAMQINEPPNSETALARIPDGGPAFSSEVFVPRAPTPGSMNAPTTTLSLDLTPSSLAEGKAREATVRRSGGTEDAVTVTLASSDASEASISATVEIPAGSASAAVVVRGVDDLWPDGSQLAQVTATAPGYVPATMEVTVTDNGDAPQPVIINEVFATGSGDANQDGATSTNQDRFNDEFIELINRGSEAQNMSGFQLFTSSIASVRHIFPTGTVLPPGGALVVFGGGFPALGMTEAFGSAWIQVASAPELGVYLLEPSARISLLNPAGQEVAGFAYNHQSASADSATLSPDVDGVLTQHALLGDGALFFSPGTRTDGTPFVALSASLDTGVAPASVAEDAGLAAARLTVRRAGSLTDSLVVSVTTSDRTEAVPASTTFIIPAGEAAGSMPIDVVDDPTQDGPQPVVFTCIAAGHLNGNAQLVVTDDGRDVPPLGVFINELDTDQPGPDTAEFIELYVGEPAARALDGYCVVLFNGSHVSNGAYRVLDLSGWSSDARGFFVIGGAGVPNVDWVLPDSSIQNGADAVAVYHAPASTFAIGADPSPPTSDRLVDAVVYGNGSGEDMDLISAFLSIGDPPSHNLIQQSEGPPNNAVALARLPDAATAFGLFVPQAPSPGVGNTSGPVEEPSIALTLAGGEVIVSFTGLLEQSSTLLDGSFAPVPGATSPYRLPRPTSGNQFFRATRR